jgi:hypothetical protein
MKNLALSLTTILALTWSAQGAYPADWLPVREISLEVQSGSPLDFSGLMPNGTIDAEHRLIANPEGRIAFAGSPDKPQRLFCASLGFGPAAGGFPDHAQADAYVRQLVLHGYNIARFHFTDASLMNGRQKDFDFDPEVLDRIHYLMAALKKAGIYWIVDGLTSWHGGYGGNFERWDPAEGLRLEINYEEKSFQHWQRMVSDFLGKVNPYTGVAPIRDDALSLIVLVNENGMEFSTVVTDKKGRPYPDSLRRPFNDWLATRYPSTEALRAKWWDLRPDERLEDRSIRLPLDRYADSPRLRDLQAFFIETERKSASRMTDFVRGLGYRGMVSDYNNWATVQTSLTRMDLPVVAMNTYHDWVSGYASGSTIQDKSSVGDTASYMRLAASARWLGKPFVMTEYDHLFWNKYRYEAGLMMPAYAAFQNWDILCRHGHGPIILRYGEDFPHKRAMLPYAIALDPIARAGETLAALTFRRGDVAPARNTIPFMVRGEEDLNDDMQQREPDTLTELGLISGIGLKKTDGLREAMAVNQPRDPEAFEQILSSLKEAGLISEKNRTDPVKGLFESDTGQLLLNRNELSLALSTPRSQAFAFAQFTRPTDLGNVTVKDSDGSGLFAAAAIDGSASLADAKRILLIYATDARNTGMRFQDWNERVIDDFGKLPVLIRKGRIDVSFNDRLARWRLSPVGLDGTVHPALKMGNGRIELQLSNDTPSGPTTFFLLETD